MNSTESIDEAVMGIIAARGIRSGTDIVLMRRRAFENIRATTGHAIVDYSAQRPSAEVDRMIAAATENGSLSLFRY